jgi:hypothetical protein
MRLEQNIRCNPISTTEVVFLVIKRDKFTVIGITTLLIKCSVLDLLVVCLRMPPFLLTSVKTGSDKLLVSEMVAF